MLVVGKDVAFARDSFLLASFLFSPSRNIIRVVVWACYYQTEVRLLIENRGSWHTFVVDTTKFASDAKKLLSGATLAVGLLLASTLDARNAVVQAVRWYLKAAADSPCSIPLCSRGAPATGRLIDQYGVIFKSFRA